MYNVKRKEFLNGSSQYTIYNKPVTTTISEYKLLMQEINEKRVLLMSVTDENIKRNLMNKILDLTDKAHSIEDDKKLCKLTDCQYNDFLERKEKNRLKYKVGNDVRAKKKIYDYARSNEWEYFLTFTFSPQKVDRTCYSECKKKLSKWLNNMSQRYCDGKLMYVCVPELHSDGVSWHFHALLANTGTIEFYDSGHKDKKGRIIFNLPQFNYGFTTATEVSDTKKVSMYITKYITKSACIKIGRNQRYLCSKNLSTPKVEKYLTTDIYAFMEDLEKYENVQWAEQKEYDIFSEKHTMYIYECSD